jgi:radical SAM protein with 4Fe4S-binding SPASM domain
MYPEIWKIQLDRINDLYKNTDMKNKNIKIKPVRLRIRLTNRCNLSCAFCIRNTFSKEKLDSTKEISEKKLLEIVDKFAKMGGRFAEITGDGEPCVRLGTLLNLMARIKKRGLFGELTTNGTLFTEDSIKKIVKMNWDMMRFSIDGKKETHDSLRGQKGTYDKAVSNLKLFKIYKKELNRQNPTIEFNFVLTNENYKDILHVLKLAEETDCRKVYILPLIELTDSCSKIKIKKMNNQIMKYLKDALTIAEKYDIESNINEIIKSSVVENSNKLDKIKKKEKSLYCLQPWYGLAIHSNGNVVPCANFEDSFGENIRRKSLKKIWYGKFFNKMRNDMKKGTLSEFCSRCCMPQQMENEILKNRLKNG